MIPGLLRQKHGSGNTLFHPFLPDWCMPSAPVKPSRKTPADNKEKPSPPPGQKKSPAKRAPKSVGRRSPGGKRKAPPPHRKLSRRTAAVLALLEGFSLTTAALIGVVVLLGHTASRFSGSDAFTRLLPFALGVMGMVLAAALLLIGWLRLRHLLMRLWPFLPALLALLSALLLGLAVYQGRFSVPISQFRILVGGKAEAARLTLAHQVFAAYRRQESGELQQLITRARPFARDIEAAARAFDLDPDLLLGTAAAESSFLPRTSRDGGQGLFQITRPPDAALKAAGERLGAGRLQIEQQRDNSYLAAATLRHYLSEMHNDLFLGLLAYNIGPKNGGLRFIMQQYGAIDFVTLQPYLQQLPRDYPIRVLAYALAFRLWRQEGRLPAYEEGLNAVRIQHIGIPGL